MSFFKDFKEDLSQAVTELIPESEIANGFDDEVMVNTLDEEQVDTLSFSQKDEDVTMEENQDDNFNDNVDPDFLKELFNAEDEMNEDIIGNDGSDVISKIEDDYLKAAMQESDDIEYNDNQTIVESEAKETTSAVTVITKGTVIKGSITSDGSLEVMGTIHGDIDCLGKLSIIGEVTGNSIASEVFVNTKRLEGSINSEGSVKISIGTVVIGDITASSGVIAGAVKGEIDINGPIVVDSSAIIKGNINAKSVQINNGAVIDGFCSLSYSEVDIESVFSK